MLSEPVARKPFAHTDDARPNLLHRHLSQILARFTIHLKDGRAEFPPVPTHCTIRKKGQKTGRFEFIIGTGVGQHKPRELNAATGYKASPGS
jgi:hypothetical protein